MGLLRVGGQSSAETNSGWVCPKDGQSQLLEADLMAAALCTCAICPLSTLLPLIGPARLFKPSQVMNSDAEPVGRLGSLCVRLLPQSKEVGQGGMKR